MARRAEDEEVEEWQGLFDAHDRDHSGSISTTELGLLLRSAGEFLTDAHITDLIEQTDLDGSGVVDFEEFVGLMRRWQREEWADARRWSRACHHCRMSSREPRPSRYTASWWGCNPA